MSLNLNPAYVGSHWEAVEEGARAQRAHAEARGLADGPRGLRGRHRRGGDAPVGGRHDGPHDDASTSCRCWAPSAFTEFLKHDPSVPDSRRHAGVLRQAQLAGRLARHRGARSSTRIYEEVGGFGTLLAVLLRLQREPEGLAPLDGAAGQGGHAPLQERGAQVAGGSGRAAADGRRGQPGSSRGELPRDPGGGGAGRGDADRQGQRLRPRARAGGPASGRARGDVAGRRLPRGGGGPPRGRPHRAHPGHGRHLRRPDPGVPAPRPHPDRVVHRQAQQIEAIAAATWASRAQGAPQDRHRHGADRRALLQRARRCSSGRRSAGTSVVEGIYSHFANADAARPHLGAPAARALPRGARVVRQAGRARRPCATWPTRARCSSSARAISTWCGRGSCSTASTPRSRCGRRSRSRPALALRSRVVYFKVVTPGHPVSYGSTWQSDHPVRVVTVPVGYGDGYFRALSNVAHVLIRGKKYPVVGRVCMDQIMVNIEWDTAYNGDVVAAARRRRRRDASPASTSPSGPAPSPTRSSPTSTPASPAYTSDGAV